MSIKTTRYADLGLERPMAVVGFPGAGLVSSITPNYYVGQLKMEPIAGMSSPEMPPYCLIAGGLALPPVRFYGRKGKGRNGRDVIVCMSEYSPKPEQCYELAQAILDYLHRMGCEDVICLEGTPRFSPEEVMVACGSGPGADRLLRKTKLPKMNNGMVRGLTGVMLYNGPGAGFNVVALLCPAIQNIPDPASAVQFIDPLSKLIPGFKVDTGQLMSEANEINERLSELEPKKVDDPYYG